MLVAKCLADGVGLGEASGERGQLLDAGVRAGREMSTRLLELASELRELVHMLVTSFVGFGRLASCVGARLLELARDLRELVAE